MRRPTPSIRFCALIMCLAILWSAAGAPLTPAEWLGVPDRLGLLLRQMPLRMRQVLALWPPDVS